MIINRECLDIVIYWWYYIILFYISKNILVIQQHDFIQHNPKVDDGFILICMKVKNRCAMISPLAVGATVIGGWVTIARDGCSKPPWWKKTSTDLHVYSNLQAHTGGMHRQKYTHSYSHICVGKLVKKHTHAHTYSLVAFAYPNIYIQISPAKSFINK